MTRSRRARVDDRRRAVVGDAPGLVDVAAYDERRLEVVDDLADRGAADMLAGEDGVHVPSWRRMRNEERSRLHEIAEGGSDFLLREFERRAKRRGVRAPDPDEWVPRDDDFATVEVHRQSIEDGHDLPRV